MASAAALVWHAPALADDSVEERLSKMEQRIRYLEERVAAQDQVIDEKDREIAALSAGESKGDEWFNRVEIGGAIELEAVYSDPYDQNRETTVDVGTAELGIAAQINDTVSGEIVVDADDSDIVLADAVLVFEPEDSPVAVSAGLQRLPFGVYETNMVSDPFTKELGDTGEVSVVLGAETDLIALNLFAFDGDNQPSGKQRIEGFGASAGYALEQDGYSVNLDVGWINDIGDADGLQEVIADSLGEGMDYADHVPGMSASAMASVGNVSVIGEYVTATDEFQPGEVDFRGRGAEPTAYMVEATYGFVLADWDATFALGYQETDQAVALGLPRSRVLGALSIDVMENVGIALEWARDDDYTLRGGGTDEEANTVTALLTAEF